MGSGAQFTNRPRHCSAICAARPRPQAEAATAARNRRRKGDLSLPMYLPAVDNLLIEDTKFVADAVTIRCQSQRGHGVQEASCKGRAWSRCKETQPSLAAPAMACCARGRGAVKTNAAGNIYYPEETHMQQGQMGIACSRTPCTSCRATWNTPKLPMTRMGHQKSKSRCVAKRSSKLAQGAHTLL